MPFTELIAMMFSTTLVFGWIPLLIYVKHRYRLEELRAQSGGMGGGAVEELRALRQEVARLRDTTTKFDVAFDEALTRLEHRVDRTEQGSGVSSLAASAPPPEFQYQADPNPTPRRVPLMEETEPKQVVLGRNQWM